MTTEPSMSVCLSEGAWIAPTRHDYELGARPTPGGTLFRVHTTTASRVSAVIVDQARRVLAEYPLAEREPALFEALVPEVGPGDRYFFRLDDELRPDPYARALPEGPHGPAVVWRNDYRWSAPAPRVPRDRWVIYELHVGAFTPEGTFAAATAKLPTLAALGISVIELMPLASFPGARGWGYDGVAAFAPYAGYGSPEALCALIDAAHGLGMAVVLDAVYNHFGPDGNYLYAYSPGYFTTRYKTPWGDAPDFANPFMRRLVLDAAAHWLGEYRFDGLRLDATHAIVDEQRPHLLEELAALAHAMPQQAFLIAEDDRNEPGLVTETGLDGLWADDFHHQVHVLLTGEQDGYYQAYQPSVAALARVIEQGWLYQGQVWPLSGKPRGKEASALAPGQLIYCLQNHDQVGNRAMGDRLSVGPARWRAASMLLLSLPQTPLLLMGQEWGARTPFPYFSDHVGELGEAVTRGRLEEFGHFAAFADPQARIPDPQAPATFESAKLDWSEAETDEGRATRALYQRMLMLRRDDAVLSLPEPGPAEAGAIGELLWVRRRAGDEERLLLVNFGAEPVAVASLGLPADRRVLLESDPMPEGTVAAGGAVLLACRRAVQAVPRATYRLQLHAGFDFEAAARQLDYLRELGVSDVYTAPYLQAESGSTHGYNVASHAAINPELGGEAAYRALTDRLRLAGMGHVLDMVPNHMGIASGENAWWMDVLENGPASIYADYFDIEWHTGTPGLDGKVLLPILGDQYGCVLERGELRLEREGGCFWVRYWDKRLPVAPRSLQPLLERTAAGCGLPDDDPALMELESIINALKYLPPPTTTDEAARAERAREKEVFKRRVETLCASTEAVCEALDRTIAIFNGKPGEPASFDELDVLLREQPYRLSYWRVATEEINYRRFFDINELAAIRMERPEVFEATHKLVLGFVRAGRITGLRLDHTDGLYDPLGYFQQLQKARFAQLSRDGQALEAFEQALSEAQGPELPRPLYVVAEKILEPGEALPARWPIAGTTGYDFMNQVGGLWIDPGAERELTSFYQRFSRLKDGYEQILWDAKRLIMRTSLSSEVNVLAHQLERLSEGNRRARDFTLQSLNTAIIETIAAFPVYRTYLREDGGREAHDDQHIETAIRRAKRRNPAMDPSVFDFLRDTLLLRYPDDATEAQRLEQTRFALKFQQVTSPVMAKGAEDTAFYIYNRLVALNEVGGDPSRFGTSVAQFHLANARRLQAWPGSLLSSATHDHKRGEDTRARLALISEMPGAWREHVATWSRLARDHKAEVDEAPAPDRNDEYLFYQTVLGAWPVDGQLGGFAERLRAYMHKATKEAKRHTSWINPNQAYDAALARFVDGMLADERFVSSMRALAETIGVHGATNGLAQTLLKLTAPGVPDTYQGAECWDQSLVDPDNRRPVDYAARRAMLARVSEGAARDPKALAAALMAGWQDGAIKLYLTHVVLGARAADPALFAAGSYQPLEAGAHAVAFARTHEGRQVLVVVPRHTWKLTGGAPGWALGEVWGDRHVSLPAPGRFRHLLTGEVFEAEASLPLARLLAHFPVALLVRESSGF